MSDHTTAVIDGNATDSAAADDGGGPAPRPVVRSSPPAPLPRAEGTLMPLPAEQVVEGMRAYQQLLRDLLEPRDWQTHDKHGHPLDRPFLKKSGWRKIARAFNLSFERVHSHIDRDEHGTPVRAEVWIRAVAPNGQYGDGDGYCSADEGRFQSWKGRQKLENDLRTTATTRAKNRSIADLVGMGEVSFEEIAPAGEEDEHVQALAAGARASDELAGLAFAALTRLLGGADRSLARRVGERIVAEHGYLPVSVGRALCHTAAALTAAPSANGPSPPVGTNVGSNSAAGSREADLGHVLDLAHSRGYEHATIVSLCELLYGNGEPRALSTAQLRDLHDVLATAAAGRTDDGTLRRVVDRAASHQDRTPARAALRQWLIERSQSAHPHVA
jgi:hypothetical protein